LVVAGGDMGSEAELRRLVSRLGVGPRTRFVGVLSGRERFEALADADVVVYPSKDEIFGLVPLEALLVGTPVVVSGDCGCGEVVRRTGGGLVVEHGSVPALAAAIRDILADRGRWRTPVEEAAARVRALFAPARVAAELHGLYEELVGAARGRRRGGAG
jgi:glycosyltransferase involved in cell wall biosynthesis